MLSKHQTKLIKSLAQKKYRQQLGLFTVEGIKGITEFLNSHFELYNLFTTQPIFKAPSELIIEISDKELKTISSLKNPNTALAVFKITKEKPANTDGLVIALDAVRDPGNLGTIIRLCDWYGVTQLICSTTTVDCYNPKVVQATMGSLTRVSVNYLDLANYLETTNTTIFGTLLKGENIYSKVLPNKGIIVLGNEANGISEGIKSKINEALTIPQFGDSPSTESLNVANATAIVLSEFRRKTVF
ncbi:MAG: TrmH family RNA methyltransferase [Winogradskyella sp.]